jgi:ComF family protein
MRPNPPRGPCVFCTKAPPAFDSVLALFAYEEPISTAIHRFKYQAQPQLATLFAKLWKDSLGPHLETLPDNVVPLPLHHQRYVERGFDQTVLLSKALAKLTRKTLRHGWLWRTQATPRQMGQSQSARQHNVDNLEKAFTVSPRVQGQGVLLVDDVVTTGSTASACARALKKAGAQAVHVLCLSRTVFAEEQGFACRVDNFQKNLSPSHKSK